MVLGGSVGSNVRVTGQKTNLTFTFAQNVNSVVAKISVPVNGFDYSNALLPNNVPFANNSVINLTTTPTTIVLSGLVNKADIGTIADSFVVSCLDSTSDIVEVMSVSGSTITANTPKVVSMTGVRSIVDSAAQTNLTLNITNYNVQNNKSTILVDLPINQFWVGSNISCSFNTTSDANLQAACQVLKVSGTSITIDHPCFT
jgi:hypothetical protein